LRNRDEPSHREMSEPTLMKKTESNITNKKTKPAGGADLAQARPRADLVRANLERLRRNRDERPGAIRLLANIKATLPVLKALRLRALHDSEDAIYRFYHQSFKVYGLQSLTSEIVQALRNLSPTPDQPLNKWFEEILAAGTGRQWKHDDNPVWTSVTRPIVEAFFHARYFLDMAIEYGE
jgi:hypothetical protein